MKMSNVTKIDINKVCRTCLSPSEDKKSLYEVCLTSKQICLAEMLMASTPIKCYKNDGYPTTMCYTCIGQLNQWHTFQLKCLESDEMLRNDINRLLIGIVDENTDSMTNEQRRYVTNESLQFIEHEDTDRFEEVLVKSEFAENNVNQDIADVIQQTNITTKSLIDPPFIIVETQQSSIQQINVKNKQDKRYACTMCTNAYRQKQQLTIHIRTHTGEKPYACTVCDSSFKQKQHLNVHMRVHTREKPYFCTICNHSYRQKSNLNVHIQTHTVEKPFACTLCKSTFKRKQYLTQHMRMHTGEKAYSCTVCENRYRKKHNLNVHMLTHTGEKPYPCTICSRSFKEKASLMHHMRTHTKEKPYSCTVCNHSFRQKPHLRVHMRTHTNI